MTISLDFAERLPLEITLQIFDSLDIKSLGRACQVNKLWKQIAEDDSLLTKFFPEELENDLKTKLTLQKYNRFVKTYIELKSAFNDFVKEVKPNQKGQFECHFLANDTFRATATVERGSGSKQPAAQSNCLYYAPLSFDRTNPLTAGILERKGKETLCFPFNPKALTIRWNTRLRLENWQEAAAISRVARQALDVQRQERNTLLRPYALAALVMAVAAISARLLLKE